MSLREVALPAKGVADRRPSGPAQATELIPVAAPSGPPLMTNRLTTTDHDRNDSSDSDVLSRDRVFILMNKLAHGGSYPGRKDDEATILAFCHIRKGATLPYTRQQVSGVPPRAPPVELRESAVPAVAASAGVAPLASTTEEVDVPPAAPLAPKTREEPVATLAAAAEMQDIDLPDANLAEAIAESERRDTDSDAARAPRKRRAMTHDDSDTPSQTSDTARPRKKASRASRPSTTESGTTIAGSSASAASPRPTKTRRPTRPPATSRQPDEDGFVAPPRRRTARAAALQQPTPLPTANAFAGASVDATEDGAAPPVSAQKKPPPIVIQWAGGYKEFQQKLDRAATSATVKTAGRDLYKVTVSSNEEYRAVMDTISRDGLPGRNHRSGGAAPSRKVHPSTSFAAATKGGPSAATARRSELAAGETRQPAAPSPASPGGEANPPPTQSARVAAPRRRRRRAGRATHAAARWNADDTLPQQTTAPRATPQPAADAPRQSSATELPQPASPVAEAPPAANAAPSATDAAELPAGGSAASPGGELPPSQPTLDVTTGRCGIDSGIDEAALRELDRANGASGPPSRGTSPRAPRQRQCSTSVPRPSPAPLDMPDISDAVCVSESDSDSVTGYIDDSDIAEGLEESLIALRDAAEEEGLPCDPALRARILFPNAAAADADGDAMQCEMESRKRKPAAASSDSEAAPSEAARGKKQKAAADAEGFAVPRKTAPRRRIVKTPVLP
ncbi:uncharacterized protein LOC126316466, partial [Schistocerca gregaria]|uniref:uncharacterized protein LOC126316466 n=1 Tax=Schistocerca gregaria TaxID=7010 RepID=UPI00211DB572